MTIPRVLVTGGYGCIGSETTKWLLRNSDAQVVVASRTINEERSTKVFHDVDRSRIVFEKLDVVHQDRLEALLNKHEISHVVHMAALQTPDCNAHRDLGLQINLAGTQNLVEAMKSCGRKIQRFVYASSIAVYGPRASYEMDRVPMLAEPNPVNVYGAWKLAGESVAKFFCQDTGTPTVTVRPGVLFGPGRDAGLTSSPTTAMKSVAMQIPYEIPFCSKQDYLYAPDVGGAIGNTVVEPFDGYAAYTLPSQTVETQQVIDAIQKAAGELGLSDGCQITVGTDEVPFICDLDFAPFMKAFPKAPHTDLNLAVKQSLQVFMEQVRKGWLKPEDLI